MKKAIQLQLDERVILRLNQLTEELHTTKTDIIEKSLKLFSKQNKTPQNDLLRFAGTLKESEADTMIDTIQKDKDTKSFSLDIE